MSVAPKPMRRASSSILAPNSSKSKGKDAVGVRTAFKNIMAKEREEFAQ